MPEIWHDDDGVWADVGSGLLGPFASEDEAERMAATALVSEVSNRLAERVEDETSQACASDLNSALALLRREASDA